MSAEGARLKGSLSNEDQKNCGNSVGMHTADRSRMRKQAGGVLGHGIDTGYHCRDTADGG